MIPSLAAELPEISDGGRVFRFRLRDGIKFHNGREITAEDISWSLHRLLSERIGSPGYPFFKSIEGAPAYHTGEADRVEGIVVLDDEDDRVPPRRSRPDFPQRARHAVRVPTRQGARRAARGSRGARRGRTSPDRLGALRFSRWERGVQVELERFEEYWAPAGAPGPDDLSREHLGRRRERALSQRRPRHHLPAQQGEPAVPARVRGLGALSSRVPERVGVRAWSQLRAASLRRCARPARRGLCARPLEARAARPGPSDRRVAGAAADAGAARPGAPDQTGVRPRSCQGRDALGRVPGRAERTDDALGARRRRGASRTALPTRPQGDRHRDRAQDGLVRDVS